MKFLEHARHRARKLRQQIGLSAANLLDRIERHLLEVYKIELIAVDKQVIDGGRAELRPEEGCLYYDQDLNLDVELKLWVITHELGHLEIHGPRLLKHGAEPDPVYGSMYGCAGPNSLTRYNKRSQEEAEANAFAAEFLCPSEDAFRHWSANNSIKSKDLAERFGAPLFIVRTQLADALYQVVFGKDSETEPPKKEFACDPSQEKAATYTGAPALVDAGPGTGKTATLVRRIEYLLSERKADPSTILVLTFSNEACGELFSRVAAKFGDSVAAQTKITTFHGFGLSLVQHHGQFSDIDANATVINDAGQEELISEAIGRVDCTKIIELSRISETVNEVKRHISFLKERAVTHGTLEQCVNEWDEGDSDTARKEKSKDLLNVFRDYETLKRERGKLDFADLILESIRLLNIPGVAKAYRKKYKWVLVDEYQDVSKATAILLRQLCGSQNPPWIVGDKRQSIFAFCGAYRENMDEFETIFPGAERFNLSVNYRSAAGLVENSNGLAALMEINSQDGSERFWTAGPNNPEPFIEPIVSIAIAASDAAERGGIVEQIRSWRDAEVEFGEIAVLARRNLDVRNVVLALGKNGIPAVASGIVTSEGAAGDLANMLTFADRPKASIPRMVYALARHRLGSNTLNECVAKLLETVSDDQAFAIENGAVDEALSDELILVYKALSEEKFSSDAFSAICNFLFDSSNYLRRILDSDNEIERSLALNEIVTTLTDAATYRFSHTDVPPKKARKAFAEHFRNSLTRAATPATAPPKQSNLNAVKVMTCHASKGLEFPYVIVAGQTLSEMGARGEYKWLPPILAPKPEQELEQSDSMFFVGSTRAKNGLVVSYARTASGLPNARRRKAIPLLEKWSEWTQSSPLEWGSEQNEQKEKVEIDAIWGGSIHYPLVSRKLDKEHCSVAIYLENGLRLRYPTEDDAIYPVFFVTIRDVMGAIVRKAFEKKNPVAEFEALKLLTEEWEKKRIDKEHAHHNLYFSFAKKYTAMFAAGLPPRTSSAEFVDLVFSNENSKGILLDFVSAVIADGGSAEAIVFRPESLVEKLNKGGSLPWGKLKAKYRVSLVLLRSVYPSLRVKVFSGEDGQLFDFEWPTARYIEDQTLSVSKRQMELSENVFKTEVSTYTCDRCGNRLSCPFWIGASN